MVLKEFLSGSITPSVPVLVFQSENSYPSLFFLGVMQTMQHRRESVSLFDIAHGTMTTLEQTLQTSFLGQSWCYVIKGIESLDSKKQAQMATFIARYQGPHTIVMWAPMSMAIKPSTTVTIVEVPEHIDQETYVLLAQFFQKKRAAQNVRFTSAAFQRYAHLPLDTACMLLSYAQVLGNDVQTFAQDWLDQLVDMPLSLFTLSGYFFAKKKQEFAQLWHQIQDQYQAPFWLTFWSEQLFRAACVVRYQQQGQLAYAKKVGFRLPFVFLSSGWRMHQYQELIQAHDFVYRLDYHCKQGGSPEMLDLLYTKFFAGDFALKN